MVPKSSTGMEARIHGRNLSFGACEHNVHDGAHQRVVYGIPDVPDQKYGCQDGRIYCQVYLQVAGHIGPDQTYGNTSACVPAAVAENIVPF